MVTQNHLAHYWHTLPDGRIQCDLCPRGCKLREGQNGMCFIRQRINNQMALISYGRASSIAVDPIEKKPLYHFFPGSLVYSLGAIGCNLQCKFCQNWQISSAKNPDMLYQEASPRIIACAAKDCGCKSVAFTYNEPIVALEYVIDVAKECHKAGLKTIAITNGYISDAARKEFFSHMDAANVDLKGFTEHFYQEITNAHLQPVLDTLIYLKHHTNVWLEIACLLIPELNDSNTNMTAMISWLHKNVGINVPLHFTAFSPVWKMLEHKNTPISTLITAQNLALKNGLHYVYTGNVFHPSGSATICHNCQQRLIDRNIYTITAYNLDNAGKCKFCHTQCAGAFNAQAK